MRSYDGTTVLLDVDTPAAPRHITTVTGHTPWVTSVTFAPTAAMMATAGADGTILWDVSDPSRRAVSGTR